MNNGVCKTTLKMWNQVVETTVSHSKNYYKVTVIESTVGIA